MAQLTDSLDYEGLNWLTHLDTRDLPGEIRKELDCVCGPRISGKMKK